MRCFSAGIPVIDPKAAEAANLDALTFNQSPGHRFENGIDRDLHIFRNQLRIEAGQPSDQIRLGRDVQETCGAMTA